MNAIIRVLGLFLVGVLALFGLCSGLYALYLLIRFRLDSWGVLPESIGPFAAANYPPFGYVVFIGIAVLSIFAALVLWLKLDDIGKV